MADIGDLNRRYLRLTILRLLHDAAGYTMNESLLHGYLQRLFFKVTRAQVRTELAWLHQQGLVHVTEELGLMGGELTQDGIDIATGNGTHPDVQRPSGRKS